MDYRKLHTYQSQFYRSKKKQSKRLTYLLIPLVLIACWVAVAVKPVNSLTPEKKAVLRIVPPPKYDPTSILNELHSRGYPKLETIEEGRYIEFIDNHKVVYSIDPDLQENISSIFKKFRVPYGSAVAIDPSTGRVLAYTAYSRAGKDIKEFNLRATYPAASLFKVVTAAGVIEEGLLSRNSLIGYSGSPYRLNRLKLLNNPKYDKNISSLENALGKSNNVIFGKIGANILGKINLIKYSNQFTFNEDINFDFQVDNSTAEIPSENYALAKASAGFGNVTISPLHSALIAAAITNHGEMPRPFLIEKIINSENQIVYENEQSFKKIISHETADELKKMMYTTTSSGTSSRIFRRYAKKMISEVQIGGKTGTLSGKNPPGLYEWYMGFGHSDDSDLALSTLVINDSKWSIKGSYVGMAAFKTFFNY